MVIEAQSRWRADSRVVAAERAWATCMRDAGFSFTSCQSVSAQLAGRPVGEQSPTALDDVTCARQTTIVGVEHAVDLAYQEDLLAAHAEDLAAVARPRRRCWPD